MFFKLELPRFLVSWTKFFQDFWLSFETRKMENRNFSIVMTSGDHWLSLARLVCTDFAGIEMFFKIELPQFLVSLKITSNKIFKRPSAAIKQKNSFLRLMAPGGPRLMLRLSIGVFSSNLDVIFKIELPQFLVSLTKNKEAF